MNYQSDVFHSGRFQKHLIQASHSCGCVVIVIIISVTMSQWILVGVVATTYMQSHVSGFGVSNSCRSCRQSMENILSSSTSPVY